MMSSFRDAACDFVHAMQARDLLQEVSCEPMAAV